MSNVQEILSQKLTRRASAALAVLRSPQQVAAGRHKEILERIPHQLAGALFLIGAGQVCMLVLHDDLILLS